MAWDQSAITGTRVLDLGPQGLAIFWTTTAAAGTVYQVYVGSRLAWSGMDTRCVVPRPAMSVPIEVGTVALDESQADLSGSLSATQGGDPILLSWTGGTYLDSSGNGDVEGFRVYSNLVNGSGGAIDYSTPVGTVIAYPQDLLRDGFGLGGFGEGGFGAAPSYYTWQSGPLATGDWSWAVRSYDAAGNESTVATASVTVQAPPNPPAADATTGERMTYSYSPGTAKVTLTWNASP